MCFEGALAQEQAPWIAYPTANNQGYGVYHFRKTLDLEAVPEQLVVHISADNRYHFFVNGKRLCYGPAKGDLTTYKYDVIDIAPFLRPGENLLAATVFNQGPERADAFISVQTALMVRAEDPEWQEEINTNSSWRCYENRAYQPVTYHEMLFEHRWFYGYYACGPGDRLDAEEYPWGWEDHGFDDAGWVAAQELIFQQGRGGFGARFGPPWQLVPRNIAFMDSYVEKPKKVRRAINVDGADSFLQGATATVPANTQATLLFDYELFTMGYPELTIRGGSGSEIEIKYAEALYEAVHLKGHRDSVNGISMEGVWDVFLPDGKERTFRPLWKRAFRYVQLDIVTKNEPLEIVSFSSEYSGYPYRDMATFVSSDARLDEIFQMSQQTLRMCSGETYYDTPYYEQLSYGGDNRPISNISIYNNTDDRLFREVMRLYSQSQNPETGLMFSAYPSKRTHWDNGTWSLAWIQSLKDYYMLRGDKEFVLQFTEEIERVLQYFDERIDESTGVLGNLPGLNFIDWSITKGRLPRRDELDKTQGSVLVSLVYAHTLDCASKLYGELGLAEKAHGFDEKASALKDAVIRGAWNDDKQLFTDQLGADVYSQHTNIMAILCDIFPAEEQAALLQRVLEEDVFVEYASSYFSFFLFKAMDKVGRPDLYIPNLGHWQQFIDRGLTTTGETGFASHDRSDCHAWSAHPAYYHLSIIAGIRPADVGFETVEISPTLGDLTSLQADMPHPKGRIAVDYEIRRGKLRGTITLPEGMSGTFNYGDLVLRLQSGSNKIR